MHILIVKHGALGDVVRTSYFADALRRKWGPEMRLSWITATPSAPLLRFHPAIDNLWTSFDEAAGHRFDWVLSLDDERDVLEAVSKLPAATLTGAYLDAAGVPGYTEDAAAWFDMGLLSRFGKERADELKKLNRLSHAEIFAQLFRVPAAEPAFYGDRNMIEWARAFVAGDRPVVGINPFAGGRWPSKEMPVEELRVLIAAMLRGDSPFGVPCRIVLFGAGPDRVRNLSVSASLPGDRVLVPETDDSVLRLAALIGELDAMVSSDSLAMHLAIAQQVPTIVFFAPTSAVEIDAFSCVSKLVSTAPDYCSYRRDADNRSITAARLLDLMWSDRSLLLQRHPARGGSGLISQPSVQP